MLYSRVWFAPAVVSIVLAVGSIIAFQFDVFHLGTLDSHSRIVPLEAIEVFTSGEDDNSPGQALWVQSQIIKLLETSCPNCTFIELGGSGLCAFSLAHRFRQLSVDLLPTRYAPAASTARANGLSNVRIHHELADLKQPTGGNSSAPFIVNVNFCMGCPSRAAEAEQLLASGRVHAMVLMLPSRPPAATLADVQRISAAAARLAAPARLQPLLGGLDGLPHDGSVEALQRLMGPSALFLARSRRPAPALHVFAPVRGPREVLDQLCYYLLSTASVSNLLVHVIGPNAKGNLHPHPKIAKVQLLLQAIDSYSVAPSDVVMMIDSLDTLAQVSTSTLLERYIAAGAPLFQVASETNCWPPEFAPWCPRYDTVANASIYPNKFLNSGGLVGRAVLMRKFLSDVGASLSEATGAAGQSAGGSASSWMPRNVSSVSWVDDQGMFAYAYVFGNPYAMSLDYTGAFFYSLHFASQRLSLQEGEHRWRYGLSGVVPGILHGNGEGKLHLEEMRAGVLPHNRTVPTYPFLLDGVPTRFDAFCPMPAEQAPGGAGRRLRTWRR